MTGLNLLRTIEHSVKDISLEKTLNESENVEENGESFDDEFSANVFEDDHETQENSRKILECSIPIGKSEGSEDDFKLNLRLNHMDESRIEVNTLVKRTMFHTQPRRYRTEHAVCSDSSLLLKQSESSWLEYKINHWTNHETKHRLSSVYPFRKVVSYCEMVGEEGHSTWELRVRIDVYGSVDG